MFRILLEKELRMILLSPKFPATFGVCSLLLLLSIFTGLREYNASLRQYDTLTGLTSQELREKSTWMSVTTRALRQPDPMQIFVAGLSNDIGRYSRINAVQPVKLVHSVYADDLLFAVFRFLDFVFIVQVVLSLLAILFTYDSITGEREQGTLQLTFAHPVPRTTYLGAKLFGAWLGLVIPVAVPVALGLLLVVLSGVPLTGDHWMRIGGLLGLSLLVFTFFIVFGIAVSALTRRASVSFLVALVGWLVLVLIIPRLAVMSAGQLVDVPGAGERERMQAQYARDRWDEYHQRIRERWKERESSITGTTREEREAQREEKLWDWMQEDDAGRRAVQKDIDAQAIRLSEDQRNRQSLRETLALHLSRLSPVASYELGSLAVAGTGTGMKSWYEHAMQAYRTVFNGYIGQKEKESGGSGGVRITVDTEKGFSFQTARERGTLDVSGLPSFAPPARRTAEAFAASLVDTGILAAWVLVTVMLAGIAFIRYDVR